MNEIPAYPLTWPDGWTRTPKGERQRGVFDGTLDAVRNELIYEIDHLVLGNAKARTHTVRDYIVVSTNMPLRKDGGIMASARPPEDPGVAVYFQRNGKPACFACDKFDAVWKNLRAIQRTIEALRGIERWGSSQLLERAFTGFTALMARTEPSCWETLELEPESNEEQIMAAWRKKIALVHPDRGGSEDQCAVVNAAKDIALATARARKGGK